MLMFEVYKHKATLKNQVKCRIKLYIFTCLSTIFFKFRSSTLPSSFLSLFIPFSPYLKLSPLLWSLSKVSCPKNFFRSVWTLRGADWIGYLLTSQVCSWRNGSLWKRQIFPNKQMIHKVKDWLRYESSDMNFKVILCSYVKENRKWDERLYLTTGML